MTFLLPPPSAQPFLDSLERLQSTYPFHLAQTLTQTINQYKDYATKLRTARQTLRTQNQQNKLLIQQSSLKPIQPQAELEELKRQEVKNRVEIEKLKSTLWEIKAQKLEPRQYDTELEVQKQKNETTKETLTKTQNHLHLAQQKLKDAKNELATLREEQQLRAHQKLTRNKREIHEMRLRLFLEKEREIDGEDRKILRGLKQELASLRDNLKSREHGEIERLDKEKKDLLLSGAYQPNDELIVAIDRKIAELKAS